MLTMLAKDVFFHAISLAGSWGVGAGACPSCMRAKMGYTPEGVASCSLSQHLGLWYIAQRYVGNVLAPLLPSVCLPTFVCSRGLNLEPCDLPSEEETLEPSVES